MASNNLANIMLENRRELPLALALAYLSHANCAPVIRKQRGDGTAKADEGKDYGKDEGTAPARAHNLCHNLSHNLPFCRRWTAKADEGKDYGKDEGTALRSHGCKSQ